MANNFHKNRILVVEDEHIMRMLLIQALDNLGVAAVFEAESGNRAREILERHPVDTILSDLEMKHGSGFELIQAIRSGKTHQPRDTKVLVITGYSDLSTLASVSTLDVQGYLVKPVSANQLRDKLQELDAMQVTVKPSEAYERLQEIEEASKKDVGQKQVGHAAESDFARGMVGIESSDYECPRKHTATVDVLMLAEGMKLRQDVLAKSTVLIRADTVLDAAQITILQDMRTLLDSRQIDVELS